jgi:hypothetical protein
VIKTISQQEGEKDNYLKVNQFSARERERERERERGTNERTKLNHDNKFFHRKRVKKWEEQKLQI